MSKYRWDKLLDGTDVGESGTKDIEIRGSDVISEILISFKTTKASEGMSAPAPANIPRIELKDGNKLLHSLTGYESQALGYYSREGRVFEHGQHTSTLSEVDLYPILFGRHLWDDVLAFDPSKFDNPILHVQYDEDISDTSVSTNSLEVWAGFFDEKVVTPMGMLSAYELKSWTNGDDTSYKYTELPSDRIIRQLLLRAYQDAYEPWYQIDEAKLTEKTGKRIIFDYTDLEMYYRRMKSMARPIRTNCQVNLTTSARNFYFPQTDYWAAVMLMAVSADVAPYVNAASMRGGKAALIAGSAGQCIGMATGYLPWHCYKFPLGDEQDVNDWYDPAGKAVELRTRASTGGTSGTGQIVLETLYKY